MKEFSRLPATERIAVTRQARKTRVPLPHRWSELGPISEDARARAKVAASMLPRAKSVADLGCRHMLLESCLRPEQIYVPVDFVARDARTIVTDFNSEPLPNIGATHFAALGILEDLYGLEAFLERLGDAFIGGVASFFARGSKVPIKNRLFNGWVNHQTKDEISSLFQCSGFVILKSVEWQRAHWVFRLDSLR